MGRGMGWAKFLGRGTLVVLGYGVTVMVENDPDAVASRASKWYARGQQLIGNAPSPPPWLMKPAVDDVVYWLGIGLIALAVAPSAAGWMRRKLNRTSLEPRMEETKRVAIDQSVVSYGQSGGITARNVINQAPKPEAKCLWQRSGNNNDGTFYVEFAIEIVSAYVPRELQIQFYGLGISDVSVSVQGTGIISLGKHIGKGGIDLVNIIQPSGTYIVNIQQLIKSPIEIKTVFRE